LAQADDSALLMAAGGTRLAINPVSTTARDGVTFSGREGEAAHSR
jgi:hypothetical protein